MGSRGGKKKKHGETATGPLWKFLSNWRREGGTKVLTDSGHSVSLRFF